MRAAGGARHEKKNLFFALPASAAVILGNMVSEEKGTAEMPTTQDAVQLCFRGSNFRLLFTTIPRPLAASRNGKEEEKTSRAKFAVWEMEVSDRKKKNSTEPIFFVLAKTKVCAILSLLCALLLITWGEGERFLFRGKNH